MFEPQKYSNIEIYKLIKYFCLENNIKPNTSILDHTFKIDTIFKRKIAVSQLIKMFTSDRYLEIVIRFLKKQGLLKSYKQADELINSISSQNEQINVIIRANVYSLIFEYETTILNYLFLLKDIPTLKINFKENLILHNLEAINDFIRKRDNIELSKFISNNEISNKSDIYNKFINFRIEYDYTYDTKIFKKEIDFFISKKNNLDKKVIENKYPRFFINPKAYQIFTKFIKKENIKKADYSFIFRIMQKDKLIFDTIRNTEYKEWLKREFGITLNKVKTLSDCKTDTKQEYYQSLKD